MKHKKLPGRQVLLKYPSPQDREQIAEWDKDPEVSAFREAGETQSGQLHSINFGIYIKESSRLIGSIAVSSIDFVNGHAELGMAIGDKRCWGKGYGTDVVKAILVFCFQELGLNKVIMSALKREWEDLHGIIVPDDCCAKEGGLVRWHEAALRQTMAPNRILRKHRLNE